MDEVYTCVCGSQDWAIGSNYVRCVLCKKKVFMIPSTTPQRFNEEQRARAEKESDDA